MLLRLSCLVLVLSIFRSNAQVITASDERKVHSFVLHESDPASLLGAFHIVKTLTQFGEQTLKQRDSACSLAAQAFSSATKSPTSTFQATEIGASLGCISQEDAQAASAAAVESLQPNAGPLVARAALGTLAALKRKGFAETGTSLSSEQLSQVVVGLRTLVHTDGKVRHEKGGLPSLEATGLVYLSLAAARELGVDLTDEADTAVEDFLASPTQVLSKTGTSGSLVGPGDRDALAAVGTFLSGTAAIGLSNVDPAQMKRLLGFLEANKHIGDVEDAYHFAIGLEGYKVLAAASPRPHLVVASLTPAILLSGKGLLEVTVTDFQGKPAPVAGVKLVTAEKAGTPPLLEQALQQSSEKPGIWSINFLAQRKELGLYKLTLVAVGDDGRVLAETSSDLLVQDELRSGDATLVLTDGDDHELERFVANPGEALPEELHLDFSQQLKVSFLVKSRHGGEVVQPQHALLRLDDASQGLQAYVVAKPEKKASDGRLHASISHSVLEKQIGQQGGAFQIVLMVGDQRGSNAREWTMGKVHVISGQARKLVKADPAALPAHFQPLPEIHHIFQQPSRRPPLLVSYLFTGIVLLPLLGLGYVLATQLGANLKGFPQDQLAQMAAISFHAGIASILGLYTIFWLGLNLLHTLPILAVLGLLTAASGYQALSRQANARLKAQ